MSPTLILHPNSLNFPAGLCRGQWITYINFFKHSFDFYAGNVVIVSRWQVSADVNYEWQWFQQCNLYCSWDCSMLHNTSEMHIVKHASKHMLSCNSWQPYLYVAYITVIKCHLHNKHGLAAISLKHSAPHLHGKFTQASVNLFNGAVHPCVSLVKHSTVYQCNHCTSTGSFSQCHLLSCRKSV